MVANAASSSPRSAITLYLEKILLTLHFSKDAATFTTSITLLPLRHGLLPLPHVTVMPLPLAGSELTMGSMALPSAETYQLHGAQRVLVLPRGGRSTFVLDLAGAG